MRLDFPKWPSMRSPTHTGTPEEPWQQLNIRKTIEKAVIKSNEICGITRMVGPTTECILTVPDVPGVTHQHEYSNKLVEGGKTVFKSRIRR